MSQPMISQNSQSFTSYNTNAWVGAIATAVCTLINPISGAAVGTYCITSLATQIVLDKLSGNSRGIIDKIVKIAISFFAGMAAAFGVLSALGVSVAFTPVLIGGLIAGLACKILLEMSNNNYMVSCHSA